MSLKHYSWLKKTIVPRLRFNQEIYETFVSQHVSGQTAWLDAGCGKHVLPPWRGEAERALVSRARLVVGCDVDEPSLHEHATLKWRFAADLEHLPLKTGSVDLVTCNMVVEHLDRPTGALAEFARVLREGGRLIVHTPNAYSYFVFGSRFVPRGPKLKLVRALDGRGPDDTFPTRYRANTPRKLRALVADAGLKEEGLWMLASEAVLAAAHPLLAALELIYIRLTMMSAFRFLRVSMLATFVKPPRTW
jgi:SAM-dependent methyltransferase